MKCPYCGNDLYDGSKFCNTCGNQVPGGNNPGGNQVPGTKKRSAGANCAIALLKSVCFVLYFFGVQMIVLIAYIFTIAMQAVVPSILSDQYNSDDMISRVYSLIGDRIHETLILSAILTILILGLVYRIRGKKMSEEIVLKKASPNIIGKVLICAVSMQFFFSILVAMLPIPESFFEAFEESNALLEGGSLTIQLINIAVFTPILEEIIFRGFIYTRLRKAMSVVPAVLISGSIFGLVHGNLIGFFYASLLGFFMAMLLEKFNSILPSIACHMAFNGASFATMLFPESAGAMIIIFVISTVLMLFSLFWIFGITDRIHDIENY